MRPESLPLDCPRHGLTRHQAPVPPRHDAGGFTGQPPLLPGQPLPRGPPPRPVFSWQSSHLLSTDASPSQQRTAPPALEQERQAQTHGLHRTFRTLTTTTLYTNVDAEGIR